MFREFFGEFGCFNWDVFVRAVKKLKNDVRTWTLIEDVPVIFSSIIIVEMER